MYKDKVLIPKRGFITPIYNYMIPMDFYKKPQLVLQLMT